MTKFRKLVENILQQEVNSKFQDYVDEINPNNLRLEDNLIYLA